jgi:glycosyltransferase involved in cell wall biosynthesis
MNVASVSVLICTFNRARLLRETLAALQALPAPSDYCAEILIVDNNSTDNTAAVVAEAARGARIPIGYLREARQGKSFALNTGLAHARGDILALTDDDVLPGAEWLNRIVASFRTRDVTFVFGKVLPLWGHLPPPELLTPPAQDIWGPLAIVDYGNEPILYVAARTDQRLPIGANLAFSRAALMTVGGWRTDLGKVNNTLISGEDHEIFLRLRKHGLYAGYYDPAIGVRHYVPAARLTRRYFRQWFYWHGKTQALMLDDLFPGLDMSRVPYIAGAPRFLYRQAFEQCGHYLRRLRSPNALDRLAEELRLLQCVGMLLECWRRRSKMRPSAART